MYIHWSMVYIKYCENIINEKPLDLHDKLPERLERYLDEKIFYPNLRNSSFLKLICIRKQSSIPVCIDSSQSCFPSFNVGTTLQSLSRYIAELATENNHVSRGKIDSNFPLIICKLSCLDRRKKYLMLRPLCLSR